MRQPSKSSILYELNVSRAPELRCVKSPVRSCGVCESCKLGDKLNHTKEWFPRSGDQARRRFILGLVRRFDSLDLYEYVISMLQPLQYKDFTYTRSRSKPSLAQDRTAPPSNHALNETELELEITNYWEWFSNSPYWTKSNYLLGLMQLCETHLLHIMASNVRTLCERERKRQRAVEEGTLKREDDEYMSLCSQNDDSETLSTIQERSRRSSAKSEVLSTKSLRTITASSGIYEMELQSQYNSQLSDHSKENIHSRQPSVSASSSLRKKSTEISLQSNEDAPLDSPSRHWSAATSVSLRSHSTIPPGSPLSRNRSIPPSRMSSTKSQLMTEFEREFFSDDYMSGNEDEDEQYGTDYTSPDPSTIVVASVSVAHSGVCRFKDFIRCLPVHLSKFVLGMLDKNSLTNCLCISKHWRILTEEVKQDFMVHQLMTEEVMLMQGATAKGMNATYAKFIPVHVPLDLDKTHIRDVLDLSHKTKEEMKENEGRNLSECYEKIPTRLVKMEERNIFCGAYNILILQDMEDSNRCANFTGGKLVVSGSYDRKVKLTDAATARCERTIQGHAGSIRCVYISEEKGIVLSGGYDTSIRCWDINRGNCQCIFRGHRGTVICIALHGDIVASGSRDKSVKVWNLATGKCRRTFRHRHVILSVHVSDTLVVSGCEGGKVKVWDIELASLVKSLDGHHGAITCLKFDNYHLVTGSLDCYALAWSTIGRHKKCLQAFRHPKEVLCLEFLYCRVITGSADGKLRVWNLLNGDCLRLIRGNSKNDAITTICATGNRMVVNTFSNLLIFNFETVEWNYHLPPERPEGLGSLNIYAKTSPRKLPRAYVRAQQLMRASTRDSLPSRPPSRAGTPGHLMPNAGSMDGMLRTGDFSKRICSAPPCVRHQESTVNSISSHVLRIASVRKRSVSRPQSSPAHMTQYHSSAKHLSVNVLPTTAETDLRNHMVVSHVRQSYPQPDPLPDNKTPHVFTRNRSAPAYRTQTLPPDKRGWTTSVIDPLVPPRNKIMVSASQAREKVANQRPQSAHVRGNTYSLSVNPVKSLSSLKLKTYTNQLHFEDELRQQDCGNKKSHRHKRSLSAVHIRRPVSCT